MSFYLVGTFNHVDGEYDFMEPLNAQNMENARDEATHWLVQGVFADDISRPCFESVDHARVVEVVASEPVDYDKCQALYDVAAARRRESEGAWDREYERLRDEVGHWRVLANRCQAPQTQVKVLEDRLQAHLATKP